MLAETDPFQIRVSAARPRVVIIGAGFSGVAAAQALSDGLDPCIE
jgi:cation diffusion facilitator CzcD-associated flavoprotein CzcO